MFKKKIMGIIICSMIFLIPMYILDQDGFFGPSCSFECGSYYFLPPYTEIDYLRDLAQDQENAVEHQESDLLNNMEPSHHSIGYQNLRIIWIMSILGIVLGGLTVMTCVLSKKGKYANF